MLEKPLFGSLTRISDLESNPFEVEQVERRQWATGDYVVGRVTTPGGQKVLELPCGRLTEPMIGDYVVGAFGIRAATLEVAGHWNEIGDDNQMHALTAAGLMGKATSISSFVGSPVALDYVGHCSRAGKKLTMTDFAITSSDEPKFHLPTILLIGTSMSSGKTTSGKVIIRQLARKGLRIAGVKLTGAGRLRDTLAMRDANADTIMDFVDAGLPSSVCPPETYRKAIAPLLSKLQQTGVDVIVAEAGASPIEPYNGDTLIDMIKDQICFTVLCASDPYAVIGVQQSFGYQPNLVAGLATSTKAGVKVIEEMSGATALNLLDPDSLPKLNEMLDEAIVRRAVSS